MALLATTAASLSGALYPATAVSSSDTFVPSGDTYIQVTNGGGSPDTVAIVSPQVTRGGLSIGDAGGVVAASTTRHFGPFPADLFADPVTGLTTITHTFTTSVTCGVFKMAAL